MIKREYKKLIQKDRAHCNVCGLVRDYCICAHVPSISSNIRFILLTHSNELRKRTNTGILIEKSMRDTCVIEWIRKEPSKDLLKIIDVEEVYLLYPKKEEDDLDKVNILDASYVSNNKLDSDLKSNMDLCKKNMSKKRKNIIILDGTWQEAQKMYNRSQYLKGIKRLSLTPKALSDYELRRKKSGDHLCTVEAAILSLIMFGEDENSEILRNYFKKFQINYKKSQSN